MAADGTLRQELIDAIEDHQQMLKTSGRGDVRRAAGRAARVRSVLMTQYGRFGLGQLTGEFEVEVYVGAKPHSSVERVADELGRQIVKMLGSKAL